MKIYTLLTLVLLCNQACQHNNATIAWTPTEPISREELREIHNAYESKSLLVNDDTFRTIINNNETNDQVLEQMLLLLGGINSIARSSMTSFLHFCSVSESRFPISVLIENNVKIDVRDKVGYTPLHYAARYDNLIAVEALIDAGADVNATSLYGVTPLMEACGSVNGNGNRKRIVELLLNRGAHRDVFVPSNVAQDDDWTRTPYGWLDNAWKEYGDLQAKELLNEWPKPPALP